MIIKMSGPFRIDNLRRYSSETVEGLRSALVAGATATADPHRKDFYDLEVGDNIHYIHLSPTGTMLLLACWRKEPVRQVVPREARVSVADVCC